MVSCTIVTGRVVSLPGTRWSAFAGIFTESMVPAQGGIGSDVSASGLFIRKDTTSFSFVPPHAVAPRPM